MRFLRFGIIAVVVLLLAVQTASAEKQKIAVGLSFGVFTPTSSDTRDRFDNSWSRLSLTSFQREQPEEWRFITDIGSISADGQTEEIDIIPVSLGLAKGFKQKKSFQPYVVGRTGPYYGRVKTLLTGDRESKVGWNANAAAGLIYKKRYYLEARYDYFTEIADTNFSGLSFSIGTRIFDINL